MSLKIIKLGAENIKCLKAVEIVPKGNTVTISGKNGQGKSSILDSIEYALAGGVAICEEPVRKGQAKARVVCDLGDIVVERRFSAVSGDSTLIVRGADGKPAKQPQALLDSLCSKIAFDPLEFVRMKPPEQVETLRKLVGLDFAELDKAWAEAYQNRLLAGRELDAAKARLTQFPYYADAPEKELEVGDLAAQLAAAQKHNEKVRNAKQDTQRERDNCAVLTGRAVSLRRNIEQLERQLAEERKALERAEYDLKTSQGIVEQLVKAEGGELQDEAAIQSQLANITAINSKVAANRRHAEQNRIVQEKGHEYDGLTHKIETIDQNKADQLAWAQFPLEGLSFDDNRVLLDGVPFTQGNQARQLQAAVAIGLALNPKVRVILIRDGSLLDDDSMGLISELARKNDAQIWIEVVNSKDPAAVVIEDGEVKAA